MVRCVHVIPSGEVAAMSVLKLIVTKTPIPKATEFQVPLTGKVLDVHVTPSGDVAATAPFATATKTPFPKATEFQVAVAGKTRCVQVIPSGEVAAMFE